MNPEISQDALDRLFFDARSYNGWLEGEVTDDQLRRLYDILKMGPTSFNCCPARFVFLRAPDAKRRLGPHLRPNNVKKTMAASVVAIIAHDSKFYDRMPELVPYRPESRELFAGNEEFARVTAFRNGSLQGAYFPDRGPGGGTGLRSHVRDFSTMGWTRSSSRTGATSPTSSAVWAGAIRRAFSGDCRG